MKQILGGRHFRVSPKFVNDQTTLWRETASISRRFGWALAAITLAYRRAGLSRSFLLSLGLNVIEVTRPNRQLRYQQGKNDSLDAERVARSVLSGQAIAAPKTQTGSVEMIRHVAAFRPGPIPSTRFGQSSHTFENAPKTAKAKVKSFAVSNATSPVKSLQARNAGKTMLTNMEAFFKTSLSSNACIRLPCRKAERIRRHLWHTRCAAEMAIFEYINGFNNSRRRHSAFCWKSPVAFERKAA